jgi:hypothetical protein
MFTGAQASAAAAGAPNYGSITIGGAFRATYGISGSCTANADVLTSVTLRSQAVNGTTVSIAGSVAPPSGAVNLATTLTFTVEVEVETGPGAGGMWLAGYAGGHDLGSGSINLSQSAKSGAVNATLEPYGGSGASGAIEMRASWDCAAGAPTPAPPTTASASSGGGPAAELMSHVPHSYFGCTSDPQLDLGGQSVLFSYKAIAEVDCEIDGVTGVSLVIYMLYRNDTAMDSAFTHVWVHEVARPPVSLGCPEKSFDTGACNYRIGNSHTTAGEFIRFYYSVPADPDRTPSIAWTSNRYAIISYLAGAESDDAPQVLSYWGSGAPNPV